MTRPVYQPTFATQAEERAYREALRIRTLMNSPAYRDPARRDPAVISEVNGFFAKHYGTAAIEPARSPGGAVHGGFDRGG